MNPWIALGLVLGWVTSIAGVGYWQRQDGVAVTTSAYMQRDNKELISASNRIKNLEEAARHEEQMRAADLSAISNYYEKELQHANKKTTDLVAAARSGAFRLRDPGAKTLPSYGSLAPQASPGAGGRNATGDGGLSTGATEFLLGLTGRCNTVRDKLTACQSVVVADRATIDFKARP